MPSKQQSEEAREVTSIKVKPALWKKVKIKAIEKDIELSAAVEAAIEKWLEDEDEIDRKQQR